MQAPRVSCASSGFLEKGDHDDRRDQRNILFAQALERDSNRGSLLQPVEHADSGVGLQDVG